MQDVLQLFIILNNDCWLNMFHFSIHFIEEYKLSHLRKCKAEISHTYSKTLQVQNFILHSFTVYKSLLLSVLSKYISSILS